MKSPASRQWDRTRARFWSWGTEGAREAMRQHLERKRGPSAAQTNLLTIRGVLRAEILKPLTAAGFDGWESKGRPPKRSASGFSDSAALRRQGARSFGGKGNIQEALLSRARQQADPFAGLLQILRSRWPVTSPRAPPASMTAATIHPAMERFYVGDVVWRREHQARSSSVSPQRLSSPGGNLRL